MSSATTDSGERMKWPASVEGKYDEVGPIHRSYLVHSLFSPKPVLAVRGSEDIGRYQISAWAAQAGASVHHSGYYVLDTAAGKVVDSKVEVHTRGQ
jgi:hypothetical protein